MYYRVEYDGVTRTAIINQLMTNPRAIESQTKASFMDDLFALSWTGRIEDTVALDSTLFLADEFNYNPWYVTLEHFLTSERLLEQELWFNTYREYVLSLVVPIYNAIGWDYAQSDTPHQKYLRRDILTTSCANGLNSCVDTALQHYYTARDNTTLNVVDPNNLLTVLCTGIQTFINDWNLWFTEYTNRRSSQDRENRYIYLGALACTNYQPNLHTYMNELIGPNIASRDKNTAARYLAYNNYGSILLWNYLDENWDSPAFSAKFSVLTIISSGFSGQTGLQQLTSFISRHPARSTSEENSYTQMILNVEQNIDWLYKNRDPLRDWLSVHVSQDKPRIQQKSVPVSPMQFWKRVTETRAENVHTLY